MAAGTGIDPTIVVAPQGKWASRLKSSRRALGRNPNMAVGFAILIFVSLLTIFADVIEQHDPVQISPRERLQAPSLEHWFGTDNTGRDIYSRTIHGGRVSLLVGFSVALFTTALGMIIGLVSGYMRTADLIIQRFMDAIMSFPTLLLALALMAMLLGSTINKVAIVVIVITIVDTPRMVRIVRSSVLSLRDQQFVDAARAVGSPVSRILFLHIAPNTLAPVMVQATFVFASAVLTEAALSFLGLGIPPQDPSWGNILALGRTFLQQAVWVAFFPGVVLTTTVLAINLVGDGLRDALDPKLSRSA